MPLHEPKVPTSSWHAIYDDNGDLLNGWEEGPMPIDVDANDIWPKGAAPNKGKGKGKFQWKGKGQKGVHKDKSKYKGKHKGKGKGNNKGNNKGKGKA